MAKHTKPRQPVAGKVIGGGIGGAVGVILVWVMTLFGVEVPTEVAQSISVLLGVAASYFVPETRYQTGVQ